MQPNVVKTNPNLGPTQRDLVEKLFRCGAGHAGVLQDLVADMTEHQAQIELSKWCHHHVKKISQA